jgi:putative iron-regulated protein
VLALTLALQGYARLARAAYAATVRGAEGLRDSVSELLAHPSRTSLAHAREAWIASRDAYGRTEAFRFAGGPIDDIHPVTGIDGPELRINSWPIDEAYLDRVVGSRDGGLIGDRSVPISETALVERNRAVEDAQVTLGFHAIEFLLWGQDRSATGPGARSHTDYSPGDPIRERRRACLSLLVELLLRDLASVEREWEPGPDRFVNAFLAGDPTATLGRALSGPTTLAAFELGSERLGVALASGLQEDEQSCFSDNTHRDIAANVEGIGLVLEGDGATPGLLVALDPAARADIRDRLARVRRLAYRIAPPFDVILLSPPDDPRRLTLQALVAELLGLAGALQRAATAAGARVSIGGG